MSNLIELESLLNIARITIEWQEKERDAKWARDSYYKAWKKFEMDKSPYEQIDVDEYGYGYVIEKIGQGHELYDEVIEYTKTEYDTYQKARKIAYNAKRKLTNAVNKWNKEKEK